METATMTSPIPIPISSISLPPSILIGETKATESAIDAYATKVLETMSPPDKTSFIDDSLGPYVTSLLRCADIQDKCQVTTLAEFDSLLELLEDQCNMDKKKAADCVQLIADAVVTHVLPFSERNIFAGTRTGTPTGSYINSRGMNRGSNNLHIFGLYTQGGGLDSFQSMRTAENITAASTTAATASSSSSLSITIPKTDSSAAFAAAAGEPSPLKPDNLISIDLMGELDDPSPNTTNYYSSSAPSTSTLHMQMQMQMQQQSQNRNRNRNIDDFPQLGGTGTSTEAFPPLGTSTTFLEKPKKAKIRSSKKKSLSHGKTKTQHHSDKDLAATLFRPARPRQNSIESESDAASSHSVHQQRSRGSSNASASMSTMTMTSTIDEGGVACNSNSNNNNNNNNNIYFQQQLNSCVEILLSMNQELSEEAASAAGLMANTDFNLAQHVVDSAMTAPPICRHMLHEGCYRSDCTFSHDMDGHTCLFWLRGRCGKGNSCKFFHGFHEKLLNGIDIDTSQLYPVQQQSSNNNNNMTSTSTTAIPIHGNLHNNMASSPSGYHQYPLHASPPGRSSASGSSSTDGGFGIFSPLLSSSWQTPSLLERAASKGPGKTNASSSATEIKTTPFSFANIASKGYEKNQFLGAISSPSFSNNESSSGVVTTTTTTTNQMIPTVRIPQDLWNPHENRDSSV